MKLVLWVTVHRSFQFLSNLFWIEQPGCRQAHRQLVVHQVAATEWFFHPGSRRRLCEDDVMTAPSLLPKRGGGLFLTCGPARPPLGAAQVKTGRATYRARR